MTRKFTLIGILCLLLGSTVVYGQLRQMHIMTGEYFWDTDPGEGNGTSFAAADGALDETVETLVNSLVTAPAAPGPHTFNVRVQDVDSSWTPVYTMLVYRDSLTSTVRDIRVIQAEYFWDTDPGQGSGTPMLATDGNFNETVEGILQNGINLTLCTRTAHLRDADSGILIIPGVRFLPWWSIRTPPVPFPVT